MAVFRNPKVEPKGDTRSSSPQNTSVGSGSRPHPASIPIETSEPSNKHTLDRNPPNPLK